MKKMILLGCCILTGLFALSCKKNPVSGHIKEMEIYEKESENSDTVIWTYTVTDSTIISTFVKDLEKTSPADIGSPYYVLLKTDKTSSLFQTDGKYFRYLDGGSNNQYYMLDEPLSIDSFRHSAE